ncbi:MAG: hypothetical protein AB1Z67_11235, partial [Candidatus Limnocylindrales bacterium]
MIDSFSASVDGAPTIPNRRRSPGRLVRDVSPAAPQNIGRMVRDDIRATLAGEGPVRVSTP